MAAGVWRLGEVLGVGGPIRPTRRGYLRTTFMQCPKPASIICAAVRFNVSESAGCNGPTCSLGKAEKRCCRSSTHSPDFSTLAVFPGVDLE